MTDVESDAAYPPSRCVILGSGFSRAINDAMPTMVKLRDQVLAELGMNLADLDAFGGDLEQWMSYLSVDQPWLDAPQNYENRARFYRVAEAITGAITKAEQATVASPAPTWLIRLLWTWSDQKTNVFTFNYDTLIERALAQFGRQGTSWSDLYAASVEARFTAGYGSMFGAGMPRGPLLRLFKLHGSTSWRYGGLDAPTNDRIVLSQDGRTWFPDSNDEEIAPRYLSLYDDVVPLIIPPTFSKGPYFSNASLRAQWHKASLALAESTSLDVIGYSFPKGDLVAQQWVSTSYTNDRLTVADIDPKRPAEIRATLPTLRSGEDFAGESGLQDYIDATCGPYVRWRIWADDALEGYKAELWVNGVNLLEGISLAERPWGHAYDETSLNEARVWVHSRIEEAAPKVIDHSMLSRNQTSDDDRFVVLPHGAQISI